MPTAIEKANCLVHNSRWQLNDAAILTPKELMSDSGEYYRITCHFCDTILTVVEKQAGTEIKCPDCFSMLKVGPPPEGSQRKTKKRSQSPTKGSSGGDGVDDEFKLSETFDRPAVSPLFGLEASNEDMLAPRKRKPPVDATESPPEKAAERSEATTQSTQPQRDASAASKKATPTKDRSAVPHASPPATNEPEPELDSGLDVDLPLPVDEVLSLDAIGKLDPDSETAAARNQSIRGPSRRRASKTTLEKTAKEKTIASKIITA